MTVGELIGRLSRFPDECPIVTDCIGSSNFQHACEPEAAHAVLSHDGFYSGCRHDASGAVMVVYIPLISV